MKWHLEHIFLSDPDRRARLHVSVCGEVIRGVLHVQTDADKQPKKKIVSTFFKGLSVSLLFGIMLSFQFRSRFSVCMRVWVGLKTLVWNS